ncbi:hypothetical protein ANN_12694 [Periplaneta americana]|uniref:Reverse transcriptase n=1 Tax=Periplaneta americana TaxID=6978 RepID=A0ABQ8TH86_PERAM|nr:hypothetical protein ANN_12694 [Periplaneta americana]
MYDTRACVRDDLGKSEVVPYQSIWHVPRRPSFVYLASTAAYKTKEPRDRRRRFSFDNFQEYIVVYCNAGQFAPDHERLLIRGRNRDNILCRRCHREPETLTHVLGSCPHGEVLRNLRHYRIRSMIAEQFRSINFQVLEEVHGLAENGSTRRIDMIAIPPNNNNDYIIDPTVRFERQKSQSEDVNREKTTSTYVPCLFNDVVSTTRFFSVDEIGDSDMVFGEMRPKIRHDYLTFALRLVKTWDSTVLECRIACLIVKRADPGSNPALDKLPD